jgi:SH3-like domain-containing protein
MTLRSMPLRAARAAAACVVLFGSATAFGADYKSVGNDPAVFYDAPTLRGTKTFVAPRGMPVEVIVAQGDWIRVRDSVGGLAWVEKKSLVDKRTVIVTSKTGAAEVHAAADDNSPVVFRAQAGVLLDLVAAPASGWVSVRHRDGQSGFVKVGDVWGR